MTAIGFDSKLFARGLVTLVTLAAALLAMAAAAGEYGAQPARDPLSVGGVGAMGARGAVAVAAQRLPHPRAQPIRERLGEIGITRSDIYRIPLDRFGSIITMVRFETPVDSRGKSSKRREAIRVFSEVAPHIDARRTPFVLLKAMSPGANEPSGSSYDFVFWQDTSFNWRLISVSPDDYFRTKIKQASSDTTPGDLAYWRLSLGAIERADGREKRAMRLIEAALSDAKSLQDDPFSVRMRSAQVLAMISAARNDDDKVSFYCQEWALAIGDHDISVNQGPIIKVAPQYPKSALRRGVEGHVLAEYAVTEEGRVEDVTIVESNPPGVFDRAATNALSQYQYLPAVKDGQLARAHGVRNRIQFELDKPFQAQ